jgi:hypothetical protein
MAMQSLTEKIFALGPPSGLFDETVVRNLFPEASEGARHALVHRAVRNGEVLRLKPGLYCLAAPFRRSHPHPFAVAALLHWPSHVSMESALRHHGLIPEAVPVTACATTARGRRFSTPLGEFTYSRIPASRPRAGVEAVELEDGVFAFVATPLRAIADLVRTRPEVTWRRDGLRFLTSSLRIDEEDLRSIDWVPLADILESINSRRARQYLIGLERELRDV